MPDAAEDEQNPFAFLDHLLPDERDSNLHLGDVRFWKHIEHIDTIHIYRTSSLEYRTMKLMCCEFMFYILFLSVFTSFVVSHRSGSLYESRRQQLDFWGDCTRQEDGRKCKIDDVQSSTDLMNWLRGNLAPKVFSGPSSYMALADAKSVFRLQKGVVHWTPRYVGDTKTSMLVGAVRIRQLRVRYNADCFEQDILTQKIDCFPKYSPSVESTMKWHPAWTPDWVKGHYKWYESNETQQGDTYGYHGTYPGNGFVVDMPLDLSGAIDRLNMLEEWSWLDARTRAVIVELSTLSPDENIVVNTKVLFEFPATSGVAVSIEAVSFLTIQLSLALAATDDFAGTFLMLTLTTAMFLVLALYTFYLMWKNGPLYFTYFWSIVDIIILILYLILVTTYLSIFSMASSEASFAPEVLADPEMFFPLSRFVGPFEFSNSALALCSMFAWLRLLKYFALSHTFLGYVRVIERCICNLLLFGGLLFLVLFGFAVSLHVAYGTEDNIFSTIWGSFVAVIVAPGGGVDLSPILGHQDTLGPILIFMYIVVVFLLLLTVLMALCVDTYSVCLFELQTVFEETKRPNPMILFLYTYWKAVFKTRLVGKETVEQIGESNEQMISLAALPEAVQIQYLQEVRRMESIIANAENQIAEEKRKRMEDEDVFVTTAHGDGMSDDGDNQPTAPNAINHCPGPPEEEDLENMVVRRVQLQRMLDDFPVLAEICGTQRSVDVIRRFRVEELALDPYAAVEQLQKNVAEKLKELDERGMDLTFDEMEALKTVSQELHNSLTESQKEWRAELLSILQMASLLSKALIDLTGQLAKVQVNHNSLQTRADPH